MQSFMIKCLAGTVYEQNCPMSLTSALITQFGFLAKSALKMHCMKSFFRQKLLKITIHNFWGKMFFDLPTDLASALNSQSIFWVKRTLKMHYTKILSDKSC